MRPLRALTYNIHGCRGTDGIEDPSRILRVLETANADVVALQEVHQRSQADREFLQTLARQSTYHFAFGPTLRRPEGDEYGNVLLSRWPLECVVRLDLSVADREPRGAIIAVANTPHGAVTLAATHLGLRPHERRIQVNRLLDHARSTSTPRALLLGDFNEWFLWGRPLRRLHRHFGAAPAVRSFPSRFPLFCLDRIWVRPRSALRRIAAVRTPQSKIASDHLPVLAEIDFPQS